MIRYFFIFFTVFSLLDNVIYAKFINPALNIRDNGLKKKNQFERIANLNRADEIYRVGELMRMQQEETEKVNRAKELMKMQHKTAEEMPKPKNQFSSSKSAPKSLFEIKSLMSWLGRIH